MNNYHVLLWDDIEFEPDITRDDLWGHATYTAKNMLEAVDAFIEKNLEDIVCGDTYTTMQNALSGSRNITVTSDYAVRLAVDEKWTKVNGSVTVNVSSRLSLNFITEGGL